MKRLEMQYLLAGLLSTMYETDRHPEDQLDKASQILAALEDQGMSPPKYKNYNPSSPERTFSRDSDWCLERIEEDGTRIWYLESEGWEE